MRSIKTIFVFLAAAAIAFGQAAAPTGRALLNTNNLNDVSNPATARNNLGLGSAATQSASAFDAVGAAAAALAAAEAYSTNASNLTSGTVPTARLNSVLQFTTQTAHGVVLGEGSAALASSAAGTAGQPFLSGGSGADGAYAALNLAGGSSIVTGTLPVTNGGTGTTSSTGTGALVLATSPTLVTPILGAATATSINGDTFPGTNGVIGVYAVDSNNLMTGLQAPYSGVPPFGNSTVTIEPFGGVSNRLAMSALWAKLTTMAESPPAQLRWLVTGSSVAAFKAYEYFTNVLNAVGNYQSGYIMWSGGNNSGSPNGTSGCTLISSSGTYTANTADYSNWWSGLTTTLGSSAVLVYGEGGSNATFNNYKVYYIGGGGKFSVQAGSNAAVTVDTSLVASGVLGIYTGTCTLAIQTLTISDVSGTPTIVGVGLWNSTQNGLIPMGVAQGGISLTSATSNAWANYTLFLADSLPDVITWEMKDGQWTTTALQAMLTAIQNGDPNCDVVLFGGAPDSSSTTAQVLANNQAANVAGMYQAAGLNVVYWDGYTPLRSYSRMVSLGWQGDGTHPSWQAENFLAGLFIRDTGLYNWINGATPFNIDNFQGSGYVWTSKLNIGTYSGNGSAGANIPTLTETSSLYDATITANRGLTITAGNGISAGLSYFLTLTAPSVQIGATAGNISLSPSGGVNVSSPESISGSLTVNPSGGGTVATFGATANNNLIQVTRSGGVAVSLLAFTYDGYLNITGTGHLQKSGTDYIQLGPSSNTGGVTIPVALVTGSTITTAAPTSGTAASFTSGSYSATTGWNVGVGGSPYFVRAATTFKRGSATLVAGTVTVSDSAVTSSTYITLGSLTPGGTPGTLYVSAKTAGTGFTITSTSSTDTSTVEYEEVTP